MTPDLFARMLARQEQLADLFLQESDPASWPGAGSKPSEMDKSTRGDRYWCKRDAAATLALAQRIQSLAQNVRDASVRNPEDVPPVDAGPVDDSLDAECAAAERAAQLMLDRAMGKTKAPR